MNFNDPKLLLLQKAKLLPLTPQAPSLFYSPAQNIPALNQEVLKVLRDKQYGKIKGGKLYPSKSDEKVLTLTEEFNKNA